MIKKAGRVTIGLMVFLFAFATGSMAAAPTAPTNVASKSHTEGQSSTDNTIEVTWTASTDADGDMDGYATLWDGYEETDPVEVGPSATSTESPSLDDGTWYFHIRAVDEEYDGLTKGFSDTVTIGPFNIDTSPSISAVSPSTGTNDSSTAVMITGSFMDGASVRIGTGTAMTNVDVQSATELTATVPAGLTAMTYDVTVTNPNGKSATKPSAFTVTSGNSTPQVEAGSEKTVMSGNAPSFSDATATDADEDTMTYTWSVVTEPADANYTLTSTTSLNGVTFTPTTAGVYSLNLTATDTDGAKGSDTVRVTVNTAENTTPSVSAGTDQIVAFTGTSQVNLNGTVTDPDAGDTWTYEWTLSAPSGSSASLTSDETKIPSFVPDKAGTYSISFVATDAAGVASATDTVSVTVYNSGDLNADGEVTLDDAILGLQVLVGIDVTSIQSVAIATGDQIGTAEIVYILAHLVAG